MPALAGRPPELALEVAPGLDCPNLEHLRLALDDALPDWKLVSGSPSSVGPKVRVEPAGVDHLDLLLWAPGRAAERREVTLAPSECVETARTIALIVKVWVRHLPAPPPPVEAVGKGEATLAPSRPEAGARRAPREAAPPALVFPTLEVSADDAGPTSEAAAETLPAPTTTFPELDAIATAVPDAGAFPQLDPIATWVPDGGGTPSAPREPAVPHLEARLGGAAWAGIASPFGTASGGAGVDFGWGDSLGATLAATIGAPLTAGTGPGSIEVQRGDVAIGGWLSTSTAVSDSQVQLRAALLLGLLHGTAQGAPPSSSKSAVDPGLELSLLWEQRLVSGLRLWAGPSMQIWAGQETFYVQGNSSTEVITPIVWVGIAAGLGWRFF